MTGAEGAESQKQESTWYSGAKGMTGYGSSGFKGARPRWTSSETRSGVNGLLSFLRRSQRRKGGKYNRASGRRI